MEYGQQAKIEMDDLHAHKRISISASSRVAHERTITAQPVTLTCRSCAKTVTRTLYPGPTPQYCEQCAKDVEKAKTRERVARLRAEKKAEI